jgi:hypothetical protein
LKELARSDLTISKDLTRVSLLVALIQTPYRFRTKRQLWTYSGLAIETRDSAQHVKAGGQGRQILLG